MLQGGSINTRKGSNRGNPQGGYVPQSQTLYHVHMFVGSEGRYCWGWRPGTEFSAVLLYTSQIEILGAATVCGHPCVAVACARKNKHHLICTEKLAVSDGIQNIHSCDDGNFVANQCALEMLTAAAESREVGICCVPTIVDTNMASTLHACSVSSAGHGTTKRMIRPAAMEIAASPNFAGCTCQPDTVTGWPPSTHRHMRESRKLCLEGKKHRSKMAQVHFFIKHGHSLPPTNHTTA